MGKLHQTWALSELFCSKFTVWGTECPAPPGLHDGCSIYMSIIGFPKTTVISSKTSIIFSFRKAFVQLLRSGFIPKACLLINNQQDHFHKCVGYYNLSSAFLIENTSKSKVLPEAEDVALTQCVQLNLMVGEIHGLLTTKKTLKLIKNGAGLFANTARVQR